MNRYIGMGQLLDPRLARAGNEADYMEAAVPIQGSVRANEATARNIPGHRFGGLSNCRRRAFSLLLVGLVLLQAGVQFMQFRFSQMILTTSLFLLSGTPLLAQAKQPPTSSSTQIAISATTGKEAVCEGGAEIIPSGQQSFPRKRHVAAKPPPKSKTTKTRLRK